MLHFQVFIPLSSTCWAKNTIPRLSVFPAKMCYLALMKNGHYFTRNFSTNRPSRTDDAQFLTFPPRTLSSEEKKLELNPSSPFS